jgi:hypothetical protein
MRSQWAVWTLGTLLVLGGCVRRGSIEEYFIRRNGECSDIKQQPNPDGTVFVYGCHKAETYRCFTTYKYAGEYYERTYTATPDELLYNRHGLPITNENGEGYRRESLYESRYVCGAVEPGQPHDSPRSPRQPP